EGFDRACVGWRHHRHDRARIDASGQEGAERYIGHPAQSDGVADAVDQLAREVGRAARHRIFARGWKLPVTLEEGRAVAPAYHQMSRWQPLDTGEGCIGPDRVAEAQEVMQGRRVGAARHAWPTKDGLDL